MVFLKVPHLIFFTMAVAAACTGYDTFPDDLSRGLDEPAALKALIDSGATVGDGEYRIVDVRPENSYAEGHIPTAINLPNGKLDGGKEAPPKNKNIIVYCETGGRARIAIRRELAPAGYTRIYNWGGFSGWPYEPEK
jgi:rhodanese-related sulfurtransferase